MAQLVMENPLKISPAMKLGKVVQDVKDCITAMKTEFDECNAYINDESVSLQRFCSKLEFLLQTGMKSKSGLMGGKKDYWNYICDCFGGNKNLSDGIRFVKSITELSTNLGRGRALLRFCLVQHRLADTLQQCIMNTKKTSEWYHDMAVWNQAQLNSNLLNSLYDLNDIQFDLSPRGYDLDASWPTFARQSFNDPQSWRIPSRSTSMSSLASSAAQESFTSSVNVEEEPRTPNHESKHSLYSQLENNSVDPTTYLNTISDLDINLSTVQECCNRFELQCKKLETELKLKESSWAEKEALWKNYVEEAGQHVSELSNELLASRQKIEQSSTTHSDGNSNIDIEETVQYKTLKCEYLCEKRSAAALRIENRSYAMELKSSSQLNIGKDNLINLLDKKLKQLTEKIEKLMKTSVDCVSKTSNESKENLERMIFTVAESEKTNNDLISVNSELKRMLNDLEERSLKIADLAKEKVLKYVSLNKELEKNVEDLTSKLHSKETASPADIETISKLKIIIDEKDADIEKLKEQLKILNENTTSGGGVTQPDLESDVIKSNLNEEIIAKNKDLEFQILELQDLMKIKDEELDQLNQDIASLKKLLLDLKNGITESEMNGITEPEMNDITEPEMNDVTEPEMNDITDPEMNKVSESV